MADGTFFPGLYFNSLCCFAVEGIGSIKKSTEKVCAKKRGMCPQSGRMRLTKAVNVKKKHGDTGSKFFGPVFFEKTGNRKTKTGGAEIKKENMRPKA